MSALRSWLGTGRGAANAAAADQPVALGGIVLPRFLRRPARLLGRMAGGDFEAPRYSASILTAGFLAVTGLYGAYLGGQFPVVVQAVTSRLGFAIDEVKVSGHHETSEIDILERLGLDGWTSTIGFDAEAARERIAALPWVEMAAVRKVYPDTLEIRIQERKPFAIWQHGSELSLIERVRQGDHALRGRPPGDAAAGHRPRRAGSGAEAFIDRIRTIRSSRRGSRATCASPSGAGTCASKTASPSSFPRRARTRRSTQLAAMDRDAGLLSRDIAAVDMRFADRLVVQLTPEAADAPQGRGDGAHEKAEDQVEAGEEDMSWLGAQQERRCAPLRRRHRARRRVEQGVLHDRAG